MGARTAKAIHREKYTLKALRGDFDGVTEAESKAVLRHPSEKKVSIANRVRRGGLTAVCVLVLSVLTAPDARFATRRLAVKYVQEYSTVPSRLDSCSRPPHFPFSQALLQPSTSVSRKGEWIRMKIPPNSRPLIAAGTTLGIGLGGFFDGILFHQLLQIHNMLSNWIPRTTLVNEEINMFWDGLFHAFCYLTTLAGLLMLWKAVKRSDLLLLDKLFSGSLLLGWGIFNLIEGLIDHELLQVHHVYQNDPQRFWFGTYSS